MAKKRTGKPVTPQLSAVQLRARAEKAAREVLSATRPVVELLASGDLARLAEPLEAAGAAGMAPLADAIVDYVCTGVVDVREAARKAPDPNRLLTRLKAAGVDVSSVEVRG